MGKACDIRLNNVTIDANIQIPKYSLKTCVIK